MSLSVQFLDELRARTLLSAVIAPSVKLLKAGREFKACCPFHQEKTPSFTVNDEKGFYHCFGCGAHGDAIRFLTEARGMQFMDAVKELAARAGLEVPAPDPRARDRAERAASLTDVMGAVQKWFADQLQGIEGAQARDYLDKRGIGPATVARFGLGLAPQGRARLKQALMHVGEDALIETGMLIKPEDGGGDSYDRFRGRLMFPIRDQRGRVIAFGGRILGEGEPKYLNSPDTILFDKGRTLYNIDLAAPASRAAKRLIVVEGYMDAIALDRAGIAEVVAPNGTAVTEAQLERMWRLDPAPILCFDGDSAGRKAAVRAALRALPHIGPDRTLRFVELPPGQDPDDVVRQAAAAVSGDGAAQHQAGRAAFEALLDKPEPLDERLWRHERDYAPLTTPEARAGLRQRLIEHTISMGDPVLARLYRAEWLRRFVDLVAGKPRASPSGVPAATRPRAVRRIPPSARSRQDYFLQPWTIQETTRSFSKSGVDSVIISDLVLGLINFPEAVSAHWEQLAVLPITNSRIARLRDELVAAAVSRAQLDRDTLATILADAGAAADLAAARSTGGMAFSFTRSDSDPQRAVRDLGVAIEALSAEGEIGAALAKATERLQAGEEQAFEEQRRLHVAREKVKERLASLTGTD